VVHNNFNTQLITSTQITKSICCTHWQLQH